MTMTDEQLRLYLDRIAVPYPDRPDLRNLTAVMRGHSEAFPFENIDVQLGRPVSMDIAAIFEKLVIGRRGGWCYEQNGLLGTALHAMGYDVARRTAGVMRAARGDVMMGNHLTLVVECNGRWLVDVGFGGSQAEPIPLASGFWRHPPYEISLAKTDDHWWRFEERFGDSPFSFDFRDEPADEERLATKCEWQQRDAESPFVMNLVTQQRRGAAHATLRGRVYSERHGTTEEKRLIGTAGELVTLLRDQFGLDVPEVASLWPTICERHVALFAPGDPLAAA
nr:arylamine N-acetyltransferase [uncultured Sphingomonas sp.]